MAGPPRVLVVGTGFGCRIQVPALRAAGFDVVGLVGTDLRRTAERAGANGVPNAFVDLNQAIAATSAAAVAVSTPPHTHAQVVLAAIAAGCHVLCEKPFAGDAEEARTMLESATRAGVVHLVGHEFRWTPEKAMLARLVHEGRIGTPKLATFVSFIPYLVGSAPDMPPWFFDLDEGGGWLGAAGSHLIDWMRVLLGEFDTVSAALPMMASRDGHAEDSYVFRFRSRSGVEGVVQQTAAAWGPPLDIVRIAGTSGTAWLSETGLHLADDSGTRIVDVAADLALPELPPVSTDPRQMTPKWQMLTKVELPQYVRLCEAFRDLIEKREQRSALPVPTFADGVASMEVLDAIRWSAAHGGALAHIGSRGSDQAAPAS